MKLIVFYLKPTNGAIMYRACLSNKDFRNYSFDLIIAVTGVSKNDAVVQMLDKAYGINNFDTGLIFTFFVGQFISP